MLCWDIFMAAFFPFTAVSLIFNICLLDLKHQGSLGTHCCPWCKIVQHVRCNDELSAFSRASQAASRVMQPRTFIIEETSDALQCWYVRCYDVLCLICFNVYIKIINSNCICRPRSGPYFCCLHPIATCSLFGMKMGVIASRK